LLYKIYECKNFHFLLFFLKKTVFCSLSDGFDKLRNLGFNVDLSFDDIVSFIFHSSKSNV